MLHKLTWIACFSMRSVCKVTPSAASTNKQTPSLILIAAVTSSEKLTWPTHEKCQLVRKQKKYFELPGVSKTFIRNDLFLTSCMTRVTGIALMLTPLSCSVIRVSV